jgi:hypothetical protein
MDNVVQLVHSKGGMAYLTITMLTDGSTDSWTTQQETEYVTKATTDPHYIDPIVQEVSRIAPAASTDEVYTRTPKRSGEDALRKKNR